MNEKHLPITKEMVERWLDVINYWEDEIQEIAERYDCMYHMYEKYDKMIDEMYNLYKEMQNEN